MSRYDDPDSPDYREHNLGDPRETLEEKEFAAMRSSRDANMLEAAELGIQCDRLRALNAELLAALQQIMSLEPSPDMPDRSQGVAEAQFYARAAIEKAQS
ncbi:MAG: hypothetical protein NUV63_12110 [Gallionella sp.]|nr:hypothetical protein [Gallionella sp.]